MNPYVFLTAYFILLCSTVGLISYNLISKKKGKIKLDSKDLLSIITLIAILSLWFPWTYNTHGVESEFHTYNAQATCIREGKEGIVRSNGLCQEEIFSGEHELTYPILIMLSEILFGKVLGVRILTNIISILTAILIFLIVRIFTKNRIIAAAISLLYFIIPIKHMIIRGYYAENLLFLVLYGLIFYILNYKKETKNKGLPVLLLALIWLLVYTRVEFVFVVPLLISLFLNINKIKLGLKDYAIAFSISLPLAFLFVKFSVYRTQGLSTLQIFPLPIFSLIIFDFLINWLFKNKDRVRQIFFNVLYFLMIIYFITKQTSKLHYTLANYIARFQSRWIPVLTKQILKPPLVYNGIILGGLLLLCWFFITDKIKKGHKKSLSAQLSLIVMSLILVALQTSLVYSFLEYERSEIDFRFPVTIISVLLIPLAIQIGRTLNIAYNEESITKIVKYAISIAILLLVIVNLFQIKQDVGSNAKLREAFSACDENSSILFYFVTGYETAIPQTDKEVIPIRFTPDETEARKTISNFSNICWIRKLDWGANLPQEHREIHNKLAEWLLDKGNPNKLFANSEYQVYKITEIH